MQLMLLLLKNCTGSMLLLMGSLKYLMAEIGEMPFDGARMILGGFVPILMYRKEVLQETFFIHQN